MLRLDGRGGTSAPVFGATQRREAGVVYSISDPARRACLREDDGPRPVARGHRVYALEHCPVKATSFGPSTDEGRVPGRQRSPSTRWWRREVYQDEAGDAVSSTRFGGIHDKREKSKHIGLAFRNVAKLRRKSPTARRKAKSPEILWVFGPGTNRPHRPSL